MASDASEPVFSSFDQPTQPADRPSYTLPPERWNEMARFADHLSKLEARTMFRNRVASYLKATGQASLNKQ